MTFLMFTVLLVVTLVAYATTKIKDFPAWHKVQITTRGDPPERYRHRVETITQIVAVNDLKI